MLVVQPELEAAHGIWSLVATDVHEEWRDPPSPLAVLRQIEVWIADAGLGWGLSPYSATFGTAEFDVEVTVLVKTGDIRPDDVQPPRLAGVQLRWCVE